MGEVYIFDVVPMGKPRMTHQGRNKPGLDRYWAYVNELQWQAKLKRFSLGNGFHYLFLLPMPGSWSPKKKAENNGQFHTQTPDIDNCLKGLFDALLPDDSKIAHIGSAKKVWAYQPGIVISTSINS